MGRVICPSCKKAGNVPDEFMGQRIKCPHCGERFGAPTLPPPAAKGETVKGKAQVADRPVVNPLPAVAAPAAVPATVHVEPVAIKVPEAPARPETKNCIYCGEEVLKAAVKCKHCGEFIDPAMRAAEEAKAIAKAKHQQAPIINVNNAVSTVTAVPLVGIIGERRRILSRLLVIGFACMIVGGGLGVGGQRDAGSLFGAIGVLLFLLGIVSTAFKVLAAMFH